MRTMPVRSRYGDTAAPRLIVMFVGTAPSSCSQTGASFFGDPQTFASQNFARILCMQRDGAQYSFAHVPTYVNYVKGQMNAGQTLFVAGYSNGGGVAACVGSSSTWLEFESLGCIASVSRLIHSRSV